MGLTSPRNSPATPSAKLSPRLTPPLPPNRLSRPSRSSKTSGAPKPKRKCKGLQTRRKRNASRWPPPSRPLSSRLPIQSRSHRPNRHRAWGRLRRRGPYLIRLSPRMCRVVCALEAFSGQVGIDLGSDQVGVAEQLLHAAQVRASVQQMGRVAMPQLVRRQVRVQAGYGEVFLQAQLQIPRRDGRPLLDARQENRRLARRRLGKQSPVILDRLQCRFAYGQQAFFLPFAAHAHQPLIPINVLGHQAAELADAQSARINSLQHGCVPPTGEGHCRPRGICLAPRRQELERGGQQVGHLVRRQEFRQPSAELGQSEVLYRRTNHCPMPDYESCLL